MIAHLTPFFSRELDNQETGKHLITIDLLTIHLEYQNPVLLTLISKFPDIYHVQFPQSVAHFYMQDLLNTLTEGCLHHPYLQAHQVH